MVPSGMRTHELQQLGSWKTGVMVERYAPIAPSHPAIAARLDSVLDGYDLVVVNRQEKSPASLQGS
ncbi:MAG: putative integrase DLP12 prophage [Gallionellaceae bacterium]|nr:MAG: putative integrase DLP12 prophage [Gallionellaceae bacterium]